MFCWCGKRTTKLTILVFVHVCLCLTEISLTTGLILSDSNQLSGSPKLNTLSADFHDTNLRPVDRKERKPLSEVNAAGPHNNTRPILSSKKFVPEENKADVTGNGGFESLFPELFLPQRRGQIIASIIAPPKPLEPSHVLLREVYKLARDIQKNTTREKTKLADSFDQVLLEPTDSVTSEKLMGIEMGSKVAETEISRGIAMFAAIICQRCKDKGDTECIKRQCSAE